MTGTASETAKVGVLGGEDGRKAHRPTEITASEAGALLASVLAVGNPTEELTLEEELLRIFVDNDGEEGLDLAGGLEEGGDVDKGTVRLPSRREGQVLGRGFGLAWKGWVRRGERAWA